jgi:hypothetical protein
MLAKYTESGAGILYIGELKKSLLGERFPYSQSILNNVLRQLVQPDDQKSN